MELDRAASAGARAEAERVMRSAELVHTADTIDAAIMRMAEGVSRRVAGDDPIVMPIMLGGLFTAVRLAAHFDFPYDFDRVQVRRYGHSLAGGRLEWVVEPERDVRGRAVLVVDDILDRGITLAEVTRRLIGDGAASVLSAVLVVKDVSRPDGPEADFAGVRCDDRFVFGCGMDVRGQWRGLPALYAVAAS